MKGLEHEPINPVVLWLAAATKDRELMALGKPQLYGTQFKRGADGKVERWPVDPVDHQRGTGRAGTWTRSPAPGERQVGYSSLASQPSSSP